MDSHEHTNHLLQTLADSLGLTGDDALALQLDENNECFITLDERIPVLFYLDDQTNVLILNIPLGAMPTDEGRTSLMYELLCANYSWNLTEGGTLGIDRETGLITLSYLIELPLDPLERISDIIDKLTAVAEHWMREIKESSSEEAELSSSMHGMRDLLFRA